MDHPDYMELAKELFTIYETSLPDPANQKLSKMFMGESFVLNYLTFHEGDVHPKDLSKAMGVSSARIATLLNQLEKKKLIRRQVDPNDNRQLLVVLTEAGRQTGLQARTDLLPLVSASLEALGPEDAQAFIRIRRKLFNNPQAKP